MSKILPPEPVQAANPRRDRAVRRRQNAEQLLSSYGTQLDATTYKTALDTIESDVSDWDQAFHAIKNLNVDDGVKKKLFDEWSRRERPEPQLGQGLPREAGDLALPKPPKAEFGMGLPREAGELPRVPTISQTGPQDLVPKPDPMDHALFRPKLAGTLDEQSFQSWYADMAKRYGLNPNPDDAGQFYDYRAAFRAGAKPDAEGHWPSDFKKPGHPNMVVGGFNVKTGERVPGAPLARSVDELVTLGWDRPTATRLMQSVSGMQAAHTSAQSMIPPPVAPPAMLPAHLQQPPMMRGQNITAPPTPPVPLTTRAMDLARAIPGGVATAIGGGLSGVGELMEIANRRVGLPEVPVPIFMDPSAILSYAGEKIKGAGEWAGVPEERRNIATEITGGLGQIGAQIATAILLGPAASTVSLFGQGADQMAERARESGKYGELGSDAATILGTIATGVTEKMGLDFLLDRLPPKIKQAALKQLADIAIAGGGEAVQEVGEGILHNLATKLGIDPNQAIFSEDLPAQGIAAGGSGGLARLALNIVNALVPGRARGVGTAPPPPAPPPGEADVAPPPPTPPPTEQETAPPTTAAPPPSIFDVEPKPVEAAPVPPQAAAPPVAPPSAPPVEVASEPKPGISEPKPGVDETTPPIAETPAPVSETPTPEAVAAPAVPPIPAPKRQFKLNEKNVVGIFEGKPVLEDGETVTNKPESYVKTLRMYGYADLSGEQMASLRPAAATPPPTVAPPTTPEAPKAPEIAPPPTVVPPQEEQAAAPPTVEAPAAPKGPLTVDETQAPPTEQAPVEPPAPVEAPAPAIQTNVTQVADGEFDVSIVSEGKTVPKAEAMKAARDAMVAAGYSLDEYVPVGTTATMTPTRGGVQATNIRVRFERRTPKTPEAVPPPSPTPQDETPADTPPPVAPPQTPRPQGGGKFRVEVIADNSGKWSGNSKVFDTKEAAEAYAQDLMDRWMAVKEWRVVPVEEEQAAAPPPPVAQPRTPSVPPPVAPPAPAPPKPEGGYGSTNTVFTADDAEKARAILKKKLRDLASGRQSSMGAQFDPELMNAVFTLGGYHFEAGLREVGAWTAQMVEDVGEGVRPYLRGAFEMVRAHFEDVQKPEQRPGEEKLPDVPETSDERDGPNSDSEPGGGEGSGLDAAGDSEAPGESQPDQRPGDGVSPGKPSKSGTGRRPQRSDIERQAGGRFSLVGKPPINLTPTERREINAKARELAETKNEGDPLTPEEQDILRQYTGLGGLGADDEGVLFQHYTSYKVVEWQWAKLQMMGYPLEGASILEPAAGVGNYLGFAPAGTRLTAVEIDPIAAKITKLLYPHAKVENKPFEDFNSREKFDIVISNVPFQASRGKLRYSEDAEAYKDINTLHDFFFIKSLDLTKANGVVFFLTSTGTMDKLGPEIRKRIHQKAEFLGSYRTPAGEFKKNTQYGGSVDAIILRKRTPEELQAIAGGEEPSGSTEWLESQPTNQFSKPDQPPANLNLYYLNNPDKVWGKLEAGYGVRQVTRVGVRPTDPIDMFVIKSLADPIRWTPSETAPQEPELEEQEDPIGVAPEGTRKGTMLIHKGVIGYVGKDRNIYPAFPKTLPDATFARVRSAVEMMRLVDDLYAALRVNDIKKADKIRPVLRRELEAYRAKFKSSPGHDAYLWRFLNGGTDANPYPFADPRVWMLAGVMDDKGKLAGIFSSNTIWKEPVQPRKFNPTDIVDVAKFTYETTGEFNKDSILANYRGPMGDKSVDALLVGKPGFSISAVAPDGTPTVEIDDEYLYGPIWPRIDQTKAMLDMDNLSDEVRNALGRQMDALTAALPEQATHENLPADPFSSYMDHATIINWLRSFGMNGEVEWEPSNNRYLWKIGGSGKLRMNVVVNSKTGEKGDVDFNAEAIQAYLNHERATKKVPTGEVDYKGRPKYKEVFDIDAQKIRDQIVDSFKSWFKANPGLVEHLVPAYNRMYRSYRHRQFAGREVSVEGMSAMFKGNPTHVQEHQWQVIEQMLHTRSGINAHGVGGGKTLATIVQLMLAKQRGLVRKPMLVVPAKVIRNWGYEITQLFPQATIIDLSNMSSKNRNKTLHRVAANEADFVLATFEGMKAIPLRASEEYIQEDLRDFVARLKGAEEKRDEKSASQIQEQIRKHEEKLAAIQAIKKTRAIFFEDLGVDAIAVDEGHNYKNAPVQYMDMSEWLHAASYSDRAADMGYKTRYIHEQKGGRKGQNVWMATATPTPNNPIEIYSMLKYIAPDEWRDRNILNAGDFVEQFGIVGAIEEPGTTGVPKQRTVFLGYKNLKDLRAIFKRYVDMRPTSWFKIKRPKPQYVDHMMDPTPEVIFEAARVAELDAWVASNYKEAAASGWIPLSVLTLARKLAADLAVYNPLKYAKYLGRKGTKLHEIVQQVKAADQGDNTQLIFVDLYRATTEVAVGSKYEKLVQQFIAANGDIEAMSGINVEDDMDDLSTDGAADDDAVTEKEKDPATGKPVAKFKKYELVNIHKAIKKTLIAQGIPEDQIAIVNQNTNNGPAKKFKIQQLQAEGKIRFLIGTTASMGEGMNLQNNTTDIHHYDVPWTPAALEQREGRGVRQGNKKASGEDQDTVRVHRYVGKGTSDAKMYAILHRKAQWNENLWFGEEDEILDFDQDARNYSDISADAQIDSGTLEYWTTSRSITVNTQKIDELETDDLIEARRMLEKVRTEIEERTAKIAEYESVLKSGKGSDYTIRLIEQHKEAIAKLEVEVLTRQNEVEQVDKAIADLRTKLTEDKKKLRELIPAMKAKGMPVLPEHEALAEEPESAAEVPPEIPPPSDAAKYAVSKSPIPAPPATTTPRPVSPQTAPLQDIEYNGKIYGVTNINTAIQTEGKAGLTTTRGWQIVPGLAVTPSLEGSAGGPPGTVTPGKRFRITHTVSGLAVSSEFKTPEAAIRTALKVAKVGDWTRSVQDIQTDKAMMKATQEALRSEGGFLNFLKRNPPPPIQPNLVPSPDMEMRKMRTLDEKQVNIWQRIRAIPGDVYRVMTSGRYNEDIKMHPRFAEQVRRAQEIVYDAAAKTQKKMEWVLHGLHPVEYEVFRDIILWEDMYETAARQGEQAIPLTGTNKLARLDNEINRLRGIATPATLAAVDRHHQWMEEMWADFVQRGKAHPQDGRVKYFPNMIVNELGDAIGNLPGLPYRMKTPKRMYMKRREGHKQRHNPDWIRVMEQYGTRAYTHNMIDDFIDATASENDIFPKLTAQQRQILLAKTNGQLRPGETYEDSNGNRVKAFQFNPGNIIYPVQVVNDNVIQDAVHFGLDELIVDIDALRQQLPPSPALQTNMGEQLTRPGLALGGPHKIYLLPVEIANKLERFREDNQLSIGAEMIRAITKAWKSSVITFNFLAYHSMNAIGDEMTLYMEDLGALAKQPEALEILRHKITPPQYQQLMEQIEAARIWNSTFFGSGGTVPRAIDSPTMRQYRQQGPVSWLNPFGSTPLGDAWREYQRYSRIRESIPKVAKFLADSERVAQGLPVVTKGISLAGLDPRDPLAVGRVARNLNEDYGAVSPRMQMIYSTLFPFITYHVKIVGPWLRRMTHTGMVVPGDEFLLKMLLPLVTMAVWNHYMYPDVEDELADWQKEMRHINTPYKDEDGRPLIIAIETPIDIVMRWGGLHTLEANVDRVLRGDWTVEEAARRQLDDIFGHQERATMPTAPGAFLEGMLNPMIQVYNDLRSNRDGFTGQQIVSTQNPNLWGDLNKRWPQTATGKRQYAEFLVKKMISPYMQLIRASQMVDGDTTIWNWMTENGPFAWRRALGLRTVNGDAVRRGDYFRERSVQEAILQEKEAEIANAYVEFASKNITQEELDDIVRAVMARPGAKPDLGVGGQRKSDLERILTAPAFNRRVLESRLRKTTDPAERAALNRQIRDLGLVRDIEAYKRMENSLKFLGPPPVPNPVP